jgi:general stress protein 26
MSLERVLFHTSSQQPPHRHDQSASAIFALSTTEEQVMGILPAEIEELLNTALVGELTVLDERGRPITHPLIPLFDGEIIYLTSSILFSRKLEHIKANPRVSLSITDPNAVSVERFRRATTQGDATVDDADLHAGWERVLPIWRKKEPAIDFFLGKRVALPLFFERGVIEIKPRRAFLWEDGNTSHPPEVFELEGATR